MKKRRFNKTRILAALMSLCMIISLFNGIDSLFQNETIAQAEDGGVTGSSDYADETLDYMWSKGADAPDSTYWNSARSYYTCTYVNGNEDNIRNAKFASFGGVYKRTIFHVYAFEGETICLGSSVYNSGIDENNKLKSGLFPCSNNATGYNAEHYDDKGSCDIVMTDLKGNKIPIDIRNSEGDTTGYIASPEAEFAAIKMTMNPNGTFNATYGGATYTPYTYKVTETGIYTFEFHSYDGTGATNPSGGDEKYIKSQWPTAEHNYIDDDSYNDAGGLIAALNITVFDENCEKQTGRAYLDCLSLQMTTAGNNVTERYYILTTDSYIYKMQFNNAAPYTYNFFANNRGITDTSGKIVYKSVKDTFNTNSFDKFKVKFKYPGTKDTETDKSFYIFLEYPDDDLYGHLYEKALLPDPATDIKFVDEVEIPNEDNVGVKKVPGAYEGMGGYFSFKVGEATTATLRLEFKGGLESENYAPVEISGPVTPNSTNYFYWDGCDGNGVPIPPGTYSIEDIVFTVTAKAGEIHFPIIDMENASGGITFTRLSHIYDKEGRQLDTPNSIYDLTKSVIYYDETAIYYGEKVTTVEGAQTEANVGGCANEYKDNAKTQKNPTEIQNFFAGLTEGDTKRYWTYKNMLSGGGEYEARIKSGYLKETDESTVGTDTSVRVGDHSHTTNIIQYFDDKGNVLNKNNSEHISIIDAEQNMINYLDSAQNPVGKSSGSGDVAAGVNSGNTTTDYAIANYWAFIPAKPETSTGTDQEITIVKKEDDVFNLRGRVFYDAKSTSGTYNGVFDQSSTDGEYLMPGVQVNLYKKTSDTTFDNTKTYVDDKGELFTASNFDHTNAYELVESGETTLEGNYVFKGLKYDKDSGTEYLYQVVRPNTSYLLTSGDKKAENSVSNGYYSNYTYKQTYTGTEIQKIIVGGDDGVDPTKKADKTSENPNCTVSAVDVGYYYETLDHMVTLKKSWKLTDETDLHPESVVFELAYTPKEDTNTYVLKYFTLSGINSWKADNQYLAKEVDGKDVDNYFVSAEYYIWDGNIYKHAFDYNGSSGKYKSFVGTTYKMSLSDLKTQLGSTTDIKAVSDIELSKLAGLNWGDAISVSAEKYRAVLDRETNTDTTITVTNSEQKGSIEIFKYYNKNEEGYALQGATFRIYQLDETNGIDVAYIKELAARSDGGEVAATAELRGYQVGSGTTRANGRLAFPGLDPTKSYVIREMFPPAGYRILRDFYEVHPASSGTEADEENGIYLFDAVNNYVQLDIGNAPSDSDFYIIKQIEGRAWQGDDAVAGIQADSFSFTIQNEFADTIIDLDNATGIEVTIEDRSLYGDDDIKTKLRAFVTEFKDTTTKHNKVTVDNDRPNYSYDSVDINGNKHHFTFPDRKNSIKLLEPGSETGEPASFCDVEFTVAGVYTFTITEDDIAEGSTLTKSPLVYTVKINVKRELNATEAETNPDTPITLTNSHLVAEVSSITYIDGSVGGSTPQVFAGSSPLFTNVYAPAPAEQTTTYKIEKSFTGRKDDEWLEGKDGEKGDEFTVKVVGEDSATQEAISNGNLSITGFSSTNIENGWEHTFTSTDQDPWEFLSFKFENIIFPVEYVNTTTGEVWVPDEHDGEVSPPQTEISDYKIQTIPVEYWLDISEVVPTDAVGNKYKGITYDTQHYYLHITLRNAEEKVAAGKLESEEEDGIIDEIDMELYYAAQTNNVSSLKDPVATCHTTAEVLKEDEWKENKTATPPEGSTGQYDWYYIDASGNLIKPENHSSKPAGAQILVRRYEEHKGDHTMTIENKYAASYVWTPQVEKILTGRTWRKNDVFTFTLTPDEHNPEGFLLTDEAEITISSSDKNAEDKYINSFAPITFTKPVTYIFTLAEESTAGGIKQPEPITITVTATDNNDGTLSLVFEFTDAEGNELDEFKDYTVADPIKRTNIYNDTSEEFALAIQKKIIGRDWKDDDSFTFTITPDDEITKKAITDELLIMPTDVDTDGKYSLTISGAESSIISGNIATKNFGNFKIVKLPEDVDNATYTFTITEDTDDFEGKMLCRHNDITLTINVERAKDTNGIPTGVLNVSATYKYGDGTEVTKLFNTADTDPSPTTPLTATIPFENISLGTLTVEKEVVSSNEDTTPFSFTVVFTFDKDDPNNFIEGEISKITAKFGGGSVTPTVSTDGLTYTYTFKLKHGDSITFSNILPYTTYTITEGTEPENYMFLRITDKNGDVYKGSTEQTAEGTINTETPPDKYTFISGKIHNLPSAGGTGTQLILLGALALIIAAALFYTIFHKNDKRREAR